MASKTAILWDVDGTLAPFGVVRSGLTAVPSAWGAMVVDPEIVGSALGLDADHFWFTNRDADDAHAITAAVGLPPLPAIDTWVCDGADVPGEWPKAAALRMLLAENGYRRVVIVDDEMEADCALAALGEVKHLLIRPDHNIGVTLDELDRITGFLGGDAR